MTKTIVIQLINYVTMKRQTRDKIDIIKRSLSIFYGDYLIGKYNVKEYSEYHLITEEECELLLYIGKKHNQELLEYLNKIKLTNK